MQYIYSPNGVCARKITFDIDDGKIKNVKFEGGCNGNLKAVSILVNGKDAKEIAELLAGNTCGFKSTSCADQLSKAIEEALASN